MVSACYLFAISLELDRELAGCQYQDYEALKSLHTFVKSSSRFEVCKNYKANDFKYLSAGTHRAK